MTDTNTSGKIAKVITTAKSAPIGREPDKNGTRTTTANSAGGTSATISVASTISSNNKAVPLRPSAMSSCVSDYYDCDACYPIPRNIPSWKTSWISSERLNELRKRVQDAVKARKIFTVRGCFHTVRKAMSERGWVEKLDSHRKMYGNNTSGILIDELVQSLPQRRPGESRRAFISKCERNIMSRFLEHATVDLLWTARREKSDWLEMSKNQVMLINRFSKAPFTSKEGLCSALREFHWFYEEGTAETYFPRCYNVWNPEELNDFIDDFRVTGCVGILKWVITAYAKNGVSGIAEPDGKVPLSCISFAMTRLREFIDSCNHCDIDCNEEPGIWDHDWDVFLTHHFLLTHENAKLKMPETEMCLDPLIASTRRTLDDVKAFCPQYSLDGFLNIWIVKPGNKCRGRGIQLMNNIKQIIAMVNPPIVTKTRYVVQKYIERPLIIHNTKFDIRQWFLITSVQPLQIWFYKDSYLRFSSQQYNLMNYHESVHLTNHAVQKKYTNAPRDERLPVENMWDCHTFQAYLRQIGKSEMWHERIYPGMQKAITGSMLASQDTMDRRANTFELFGADFMISEDFYPWLIEINSSPDLAPSTSVTARLCPQCVEDSIKVVIDRKADINADTGSFVMIFKQLIPKTPAYMGLNLSLRGHRIVPKSNKKDRIRISPGRSLQSFISLTRNNSPLRARQHSPVIMDLIDCLNLKSKFDQESEDGSRKPRRDMVYKRPITLSSLSRARVGQRRSLLRHSTRSGYDEQVEVDAKLDYLRRHTSCGPKMQMEENGGSSAGDSDNNNGQNSSKEIICLGSKLNDNSLEPERPSLSASNASLASSNQNGNDGASDEHSDVTPTQKPKAVPFHKCKGVDNDITIIRTKIRKSTSSTNINRLASCVQPSAGSSHFYAVGMSLKAWRAKYNNILRAQKENFPSTTGLTSAKVAAHQKARRRSPRRSPIRLRLLKTHPKADDDEEPVDA